MSRRDARTARTAAVLPVPAGVFDEYAAASPDLLAALDPDGTLLAVNPAWQHVLGWREDEVVGSRLGWLLHPEDRGPTIELFYSLVAQGTQMLDVEVRCQTADGDWRWLSWSGSVAPATGRVFVAGRDVTRRTERYLAVRTSETLLAHAERIARIGSWEWDPGSRLIRCSRELQRIGNLDVEVIDYAAYMALVHPGDRPRIDATLTDAIRRRTSYEIDYTMQRPDGHEIEVFERGEPILRGGRLLQYVGTVQDVSEQRQREEELRRALATEHDAAERLRNLDQLKSSFLSAVSHELRTPLTVLRGLAQTLQQHDRDLDPELRTRIQASLVDQSTRLGDLLADLLDLNRLSRGDAASRPSQPIDLAGLVRTAVAEQPDADRIRLEAPDHLDAAFDPVHVERILVNLLDNARKYAPEGEVEVSVRAPADDLLRIEVRDHGEGIPPGSHERIFEPFYRDDHRHPQPGTGVGLSLVAEFARINDGRAWAEDAPDGGAIIIVELPGIAEPAG